MSSPLVFFLYYPLIISAPSFKLIRKKTCQWPLQGQVSAWWISCFTNLLWLSLMHSKRLSTICVCPPLRQESTKPWDSYYWHYVRQVVERFVNTSCQKALRRPEPRQAIIWTAKTRKQTLRVRVSYVHARKACKSGQARIDPLERDEIDDGSLHRQRQDINSLYRQEALFFCLLCIKIPLSACSTTNSTAFLGKNDGGASAWVASDSTHFWHLPSFIWLLRQRCEPVSRPCSTLVSRVFISPVVNTHHCTILCFYDNTLQIIYAGVCSG